MTPLLQPNEQVIAHMRANHLMDGMHMKGTLWLTNQRLLFRTHRLNARQYDMALWRTDIVHVELVNHLWIFPYGLMIIMKDQTAHHLAVWRRRALQRQITHPTKS
jgi:hypothetical protein